MSLKRGKLIVFSAPSGSGKTTLVHHLIAQRGLNLDFSISATSREKRGNEKDGKDYYFEWEEVYQGNLYGTLKSEIERIWSIGKHVIFDIDVVGGLRIKEKFPEQTLAVFVQPPSIEEMEFRLRNRKTDTEEKIKERVQKAERELKFSNRFDVVLVNDNLEKAKIEAYNLVSNFINN